MLTIDIPFGSNYQEVAVDEHKNVFDEANLPTAVECKGTDIKYFWTYLHHHNTLDSNSKYENKIYKELPLKAVFDPNAYIIHFFKNSIFYRTELRVYYNNFNDYYQLLDLLGIDASMINEKRNYYFNGLSNGINFFCAVQINPDFDKEVKIILGRGDAANYCSSDSWVSDTVPFNYVYNSPPFIRRMSGTIDDPIGFRDALAPLQPPPGAHGAYGTLGDDSLLGKERGYGLRQLGQIARKYLNIKSIYVEQPEGYGSFIQSGVFKDVNEMNDATLGWVLYDLRPQFETDLNKLSPK